jgi:hypothetical protein
MRIEALVNGEPVCTAGLSCGGYLSAHLNTQVGRAPPADVLRLVGIETRDTESVHLQWPAVPVREGDVVTLNLLADGPSSEPSARSLSSAAPSNLFTNLALASRVLSACATFEAELTAVLGESRTAEPQAEHAKFQRALGEVAANLGERLLYPIYRNHASLVPPELRGELL